jgi:hypothetical protein
VEGKVAKELMEKEEVEHMAQKVHADTPKNIEGGPMSINGGRGQG